jgi:hypothetical protein
MTFRRTAGGGLAACASLSAVAALLVPGSSATATQSGRHAVSASKAATETIQTTCNGPRPAGPWFCVARSSSAYGPTKALRGHTANVKKTRYSWSYAETDEFGIGETTISKVLWRGGINFNGREGHVTQDVRLFVGAEFRTEFFNKAIDERTGEVGGHFSIIDPEEGFATRSTMRGGWWPYFHHSEYQVTYRINIFANGAPNPSTADGAFASEQKETPLFNCGHISTHTVSCYFP